MLEATMRCEVDQHGVRLTELQFGGREGSAFHLHGEGVLHGTSRG